MTDERAPEPAAPGSGPAPAPAGRGPLRIFLMVAGGLAAPALALAAFFLTNSGQTATSARPPAAQAGVLKSGSGGAHPSAGAGSATGPAPAARPATTTTTTPPAPPAGPPPRDPFAPLLSQGPPATTTGH
ncbi:MAG TPA: hypothetical protein VFE55_07090 [Acidimicrobiia bacterium]|nr:hypothetical protein [Acidimicrobiia bacterium]